MAEQNVDNCIRRLFEDVWNRGQTELINEICSSNSMLYFGIEASRNRDQLKTPGKAWGLPFVLVRIVCALWERRKHCWIPGHRTRPDLTQRASEATPSGSEDGSGRDAGRGHCSRFQQPLQVVLGYSELVLADEDLPDHFRDDLGKVLLAGRNGADLVQRLLTFSRKTETKPLDLDLNQRIRQTQKFLERTIPKMIDIELILAEDLARIHADPTQVDQVLMNLAVNARDAMPEGGKLVIETANVVLDEDYARSHLEAKPGRYVLLRVSDTGSGMDKETLEHIFEPFYTTKGPGEGTGLGLAMVYGIVKQHHGFINCYSEVGHGTTFKIYLPAIISETQSDQPVVTSTPQGGTETILLVDDEELDPRSGETDSRQKQGTRC